MKDRADYEVGTLENKIEIDIGNAQADLQKLISSISTLNSSLSGLLNNNGLKSISQDMKSLKNDTSLVDPLLKNLKELQTEFSRGGKNQLANQIREFTKELYKTEYSKSDEKIEEIRNLIEQKLGHNFVEEFNQSLKETGKSKDLTEKVLNIGDALKATIKLGVIFATLKKGFSIVKDVTQENIDMIETTNLFEVMMGKVVDQYGNLDEAQSKYYLNAIKFQDDMTSKLLVNRRELMETQSMFYSLYKNQGVNKEKSYFLSEQLSKAVYDLSSLYNTDTETMKKALISGITGQVESLRNVAKVDISEMSLQPILDQLGIERSVQQLNYAEKELVRYMAILKQAGQAQGDFARTMDTPAQQIRIFQAQLAELKITAGSFFSGLFGQIMPYVNGIIMAITTILKLLGDVFGFKVESAPVQSSLDGVADTVGDIGSGLGGATKQAKEFKKQLMGFDEINNITPPTQTSGGSGGGGGSVAGIDSRLLEALDDWDNKMKSISGKAQEIRDKILKWLGVTDGSYKNLKKILEVAKLVGTAIGAWTIGSTVANFLKNWGKLSRTQAFQLATGITLTITGLVAQFSGTKQLLDGNWTLANIVETAFGTSSGALGIASIIKSLSKGKISFGKGLTIGFGIMLVFQALQVLADGIKNHDIWKEILGVLELSGATFLGLTAAGCSVALPITLAVGITATLASIAGELGVFDKIKKHFEVSEDVKKLRTEISNLNEEIKNLTESYKNAIEKIEKSRDSKLLELESTKRLSKQLDGLVDSNGRVIKGNEKRVDLILGELNKALGTEFSRNEELIENNGEVVKSYDELKGSIAKVIEKKKEQAKQEALMEIYKENIKHQIELEQKRAEIQEKIAEVDAQIAEKEAGLSEKELERLKKKDENYKKLTGSRLNLGLSLLDLEKEYGKTCATVEDCEKRMSTTTQISTEEISSNISGTAKQIKEQVASSTEEQLSTVSENSKKLIEVVKAKGKSVTKEEKKALNDVLKNLGDKLVEQTKTIKELTPDQVKAWETLGEGSEEIYNEKISQIDPDTKLLINTINGKIDKSSSDFIQKWKNMATNSHDEYEKALEVLPEETKAFIEAINDETLNLTPENVKNWKDMAHEDYSTYETEMKKMPKETRWAIQEITGVVIEETPTVAKATKQLSEEFIENLDNDKEAKKQAISSIKEYLKGLSDKEQLQLLYLCGVKDTQKVMEGLKKGNLAEDVGIQILKGLRNGLNNGNWRGILLNNATNLASKILGAFTSKKGFDEHSPSKKTYGYGIYLLKGLANGIDNESSSVLKTVSNLASNILANFNNPLKNAKKEVSKSFDDIKIPDITKELKQGIKINPKDFEVDTNQYVNYSAIKGKILAQSQVNMNRNIPNEIAEASYNAFVRAMRDEGVNIEVKADEGIIFKKVQKSADQYYKQTGKPAFGY